MTEKQYIKKVPILDEHSTPRARADRLRRLRSLAGLSRKEMCDDGSQLNVNTLKGWELGKFGGLPRDGADKVIRRTLKAGVHCKPDWLLFGTGQGPKIVDHINYNMHTSQDEINTEEMRVIFEEIVLLKKQYTALIEAQILDDGMLPTYSPGDWVAGIKVALSELPFYIGAHCIIQLSDGSLIIRNLRQVSEDKCTFVCVNPAASVLEPTIFNASVSFVAPIVWHRTTLKNVKEKLRSMQRPC